ncbi:hypothetical protein DSM112329_03280 [Paraconexibacter sp. AEG42_29]|uniref:F5/8 type C domain-containing protein n=1 Tax=Paraconexibacter sp. AEG42_29 TaxID=2997339 RepID=A0AAU7AYB7_9ACTN
MGARGLVDDRVRGRIGRVVALAAVTCALGAPAQAVTVGEPVASPILLGAGAFTEVPPEVLSGPRGLSYYFTAEQSARCDTPAAETMLRAQPPDCQAEGRTVPQVGADYLAHTAATMPAGREHRRTYYGVYSADRVRDTAGRSYIVGAAHGENKNAVRDGSLFQNNVYLGPDALGPPLGTCLSGPDPETGIYADCYSAYSGFIGMTVTPDEPDGAAGRTPPEDLGPVIWPAAGYSSTATLVRLGHGVRHPYVVNGGDGFLYMYYHDDGFLPDFRGAGFRVARAPERDLGRGWQTWVESASRWVTSLPSAPVGPESSRDALPQPSPSSASTPLFPSDSSTFAVARIAGGKGLIGVDFGRDYTRPCVTADGRDDWRSAMRLRVSTDRVHWSEPVALEGPDFDGCDFYPNSRLTYPRFLNATATTTKEVALEDFFIEGTQYGGRVWRVAVKAPDLASRLPTTAPVAVMATGPKVPTPVLPVVGAPNLATGTTSSVGTTTPMPMPVRPGAKVDARAARVAGSRRPRLEVVVRRCNVRATRVRIVYGGRFTTIACGARWSARAATARPTYTVTVQALRVGRRGNVVAKGRVSTRVLRAPKR